jgi:acyl-CoA dehydrogenase
MTETSNLITETADRLFASLVDVDPAAALKAVGEAGFLDIVRLNGGEEFGSWKEAFEVFRLVGYHALPTSIADLAIANWLDEAIGFNPRSERSILALRASGTIIGEGFSGDVLLPGTNSVSHVLADLDGALIRLRCNDGAKRSTAADPAGEAHIWLRFDRAKTNRTESPVHDIWTLGAFARACQIAGALQAILALSVDHANERVQFGKPIGKFQAVQQNLALLAEETAAAYCAASAAAAALCIGNGWLEVGSAKLRANMAAERGAAIAHQVHGAIGFTQEHRLQNFTRRLISWSAAFGSERFWSERIGRKVAQLGPDGLWPELTRRSDLIAEQRS